MSNSGASEVVSTAICEQRSALRAFVRARVPAGEVDDLLQSAALRALERADTLDRPERVSAWLFQLHRNLVVDAARKRASRRQRVDEAGEKISEVPAPEHSESCRCSLRQAGEIPASYASIIALVDVDQLTLREAAETLGISVNNATVRLHRARRALRSRMREHCGVESLRDCSTCRCVYAGCCV